VLSERREALTKQSVSLLESIKGFDDRVKTAEEGGEHFRHGAALLDVGQVLGRAGGAEAALQSAGRELAELQARVSAFRMDALRAGGLRGELRSEVATMGTSAALYGSRLGAAAAAVVRAKQGALCKACERYDALRLEVAGKLRACIESRSGKAVDLFQVIAREGADRISAGDIQRFLAENQTELEPGKIRRVFIACARGFIIEEEDSRRAESADAEAFSVGREDFMRIIRVYCKVVKDVALTDSLAQEGGEQLRQMSPGEVMEIYQGPTVEPAANVLRVHGRAFKDGTVGWATISGGQGDTFLVPGGNLCKVVKQCGMVEDLKDLKDLGTAKTSRTLSEGELVEVLDWSRPALGASGATRVRGRARGDKAVGWMPMADASGTALLQSA